MKKLLVALFLLLGFICGCEKKLDVEPRQSTKSPQYNFLARSPDAVSDTVQIGIYLRQLDYASPTETYRIVVSLPVSLDGVLVYKNQSYRSGDWIDVAYAELVDFETVIRFKPFEARSGTHTVSLGCSDRSGQAKNASVTIALP